MLWSLLVSIVLFHVPGGFSEPTSYNVGVGIADITGPAAGVGMMGYANPTQTTAGIHIRLYARSFVICDVTENCVVFVNLDCGMAGQLLKMKVIEELSAKYGERYTAENVLITGTHTHSSPAGFLQYVLFDITNLGFINDTFAAMVEGTVRSIERAHDNIKPAILRLGKGELLDANINRSPTAYELNPETEKNRYKYNTDKDMVQLRVDDADGEPMGLINWFAVHGTSMNNTNTLISGDNKGYAEQLFELHMNPNSLPGKGPFVAAFAQSNLGDVSPNTNGAHCLDTGLPCDTLHSTCNGRNELCVASGPGKDMFESTAIIGQKQFDKAVELYATAEQIDGPVSFIHQYVNMTDYIVNVTDENGTVSEKRTCPPAMGYSFAAGTTDGPGAFDFKQGDTEGNPFWNRVRNLIKEPSPEQIACHSPKPILLDTGEITMPYLWQPQIVSTQILQVGSLVILAVPGEFTTMSGRRLRKAVQKVMGESVTIVIAGLTNTYADYITTYEEYQQQRYEGASTIYGPFTLLAYQKQFVNLATAMGAQNKSLGPGPSPPDMLYDQLSFLPPVIVDNPSLGHKFGDCTTQPKANYTTGDSVEVTFVSGHPRNDMMLENTFLTIERKDPDGKWNVVATDANWETKFHWERTNALLGMSEVTVTWVIPPHTQSGTYRIQHFGYHKELMGPAKPYQGSSKAFTVEASTLAQWPQWFM